MSGPDLDTLYYGDCLDWMRRWDDCCVDLIYRDPPFNSRANYDLYVDSATKQLSTHSVAVVWGGLKDFVEIASGDEYGNEIGPIARNTSRE